jgi:hypothetical protein
MKKSTWILLVILALLAGATVIVMQRPGETSSSGPAGSMLVEYDSAAVDRIEIRSPGREITLEKQGGVWFMTSPLRYAADGLAVTSALANGRKIPVSSPVSTNPQKQSLFQLDSTGTLVKMSDRGTARAAFLVGKPGPSYTETYVRREGSDDVYLAAGLFGTFFTRPVDSWRDKTIFTADQSAMKELTLTFGDTVIVLARPDSVWRIGTEKLDEGVMKGLLSALGNIQADEFIDTAVTAMPPLTARIEVLGTQIDLFWKKADDRYYVRTSASPQLFQVYSWKVAPLVKRKQDLFGSAH